MSCNKTSAPDLAASEAPAVPLKFEVKLASDPRLLSVVRSMVSQFAAIAGFDETHCLHIMLAVDEALSNVIRHAYKNRCDCQIDLVCEAHADCLEFAFLDRGEPPDLSRICAEHLDAMALSGRGTHLIREIMDEVGYEQRPEGNRLFLKKFLPGRSQA